MKNRIINTVIFAVALLSTIVALQFLPDIVPTHFDIGGVADDWGSKYTLLMTPVIILAMQLVGEGLVLMFRRQAESAADDKTRAEAEANLKLVPIVFLVVSVMFAIMNFVFLYMTFTQLDATPTAQIDVMKIVVALLGLSFIVIGNYMPKARKNSTFGLRCKWSMYNDLTWARSNKFGGIAFMMLGAAMILFSLTTEGMMTIIYMMAALIWVILLSLIYAYVVYRQEKVKEQK